MRESVVQNVCEIEFIISNNRYFAILQVIKIASFQYNFYDLHQIVENDSFEL